MGKLHQILAVEDSAMATFKKVLEEGVDTFSKKEHLFQGRTMKQDSLVDEKDPKYREFPNKTETIPVAETVDGKLRYILDHAAKYFDIVAQKDATNQNARADLKIDNQTILTDVPAVTLLFIENKFKVIRGLIESIKVRDHAKVWEPDGSLENVMKATPVTRPVKEIVKKYHTVVPQTEKHPAQVKEADEPEIRAYVNTTEQTGLISSTEKSALLNRCDKIIEAAKVARQTANDVETKNAQISKGLISFLLG